MNRPRADIAVSGYTILSPVTETDRTRIDRGQRTADRRPVLLKSPLPGPPDSDLSGAIRREYHLLSHLDGIEGICRVIDLGYHRDLPVLIMEDPGCRPLSEAGQSPLTLDGILRLGARIAGILEEIHGRGIVHGDLNPANLMATPGEGAVFLFNFEAAACPEAVFPAGNGPVQAAHPAYRSPEAFGRMDCRPDWRSDFYSLGVLLYELMTGRPPFEAADPGDLIYAHMARQPAPLRSGNGDGPSVPFPSVVSDLILKLMAKSPADRYRSGAGIRIDLEECRHRLKATGGIADFPLGRRDGTDRLVFPERLYGREEEMAALRRVLEAGREGGRRLVLVSGDPGIGKTSLVRRAAEGVRGEGMRLITGKFRPVRENIPYSGIADCLADLVRQVSAGGETAKWRERISEALGTHVRVILDLAPEAAAITGPAPELPELGPLETRNRSELAVTRFFNLFQSAERPLAIFLDDLQWADEASIRLTAALLTLDEAGFLTLIGAFRDKEVDSGDAFTGALAFLEEKGIPVRRIHLAPLDRDETAQLIQDCLGRRPERAGRLSERVIARTRGNPYFIRECLKRMHRDGALWFDRGLGEWRWQPGAAEPSDTLPALLRSEMAALPEPVRQALFTAACIGQSVDEGVLAAACGIDRADVPGRLQPAVDKGYIETVTGATHRFADDLVQQAAFSLVPEARRGAAQREIGQALLQRLTPEALEHHLFDVVGLLNQGEKPDGDPAGLRQTAGLNLLAGRKARSTAAYKAAHDYFMAGLRALGGSPWRSALDLSLSLHLEAAETAYLVGRFETADSLVREVLNHARRLPEKTRAVQVRLLSLMARNRTDEAVEAVLAACGRFGIRLPGRPGRVRFLMELVRIRWQLKRRPPEAVLKLSRMTDPDLLAVMRLLSTGVSIFYLTRPAFMPLLMFRMVSLSLKHGAAPESPFAYAIYGLILCGACRRVARGYRFGRMALTLSERSDNDAVRTKTAMLFYGFIHPWKHPLRDSLPPLLATYRAGMENGDLEYAAWTLHIHSYHAYFSGRELTHLSKEMADHETAIGRTGQKAASVAQSIYRQAVLNLLTPGPDPCRLTGEAYDEIRMLPRHQAAENTHAIFNVHFHKLILNTLFGRFREALDQADKADACLQSVTGLAAVYLFYFYRALAGYGLAALSEGAVRRLWAGRAAAWQRKLTVWSRHAPMNFQHKYDLLTAERHRAAGRFQKAAEHYVLSVTGAWDNGYIQDEALAAERAGRFYMARGMRVPARTCLLEARRACRRWGAEAKAAALTSEWRDLFAESGVAGEGGGVVPLPEIVREAGAPEMAAVMAAARTLSGEMHLETLLKLIMEIVMKHSGARRGCLLIHRQGRLTLEAEAAIEPDRLRVLPGTDLSEVETVSRTIVEAVVRTRTQRILRDALQDDRFGADGYIRRHRSRSVLALPLVHKDELTGVLYLENELAAGAFTADRVEMMRLFSSQAAVFIQNALLYRQLAQSEEKYRSIFENAAEGIFRADESGRIIDINPAFFRMLGCPSREDCLCWLAEPAPAEGAGSEKLGRLLREQKPVERMEMAIRRRDGGTFQAAVSAARVGDSQENRYFYEGTVLDITAEKNRRSEEEAIAEERRRIAREIHDGVAQDLAFIRLRTAKWRRMIGEDPERLDGEFDRLRDLLGKNIREVRRSIFALRPADLENLGFFPALERFFDDFREQMEIQLLFRVTGPHDALPASMEPGIFRILQESLNNVAKHAGADTAWVTLEIRDAKIRLTVEDNGRGFHPADLEKGGRLGIQQMRERMHHFGGAFFLSPREGGGARVQAVFPVQKGDAT